MIAGPNGSGKSTIVERLRGLVFLGLYLNADDIEKALRAGRDFHLQDCPDMAGWQQSWKAFLEFNRQDRRVDDCLEFLDSVRWSAGIVHAGLSIPNSYAASLVVQFCRERCIAQRHTCTVETVMSHSSKVDFLREARASGFRTYLYFVATAAPEINESRVRNRVEKGGHDVPTAKIRARYYRSIELLPEAVSVSDRAFVFDNSGHQADRLLVAEWDGSGFILRAEQIPHWLPFDW